MNITTAQQQARWLQVAEEILSNPKGFDYETWTNHPGHSAPQREVLVDLLEHKCGTTGCLAGYGEAFAFQDKAWFEEYLTETEYPLDADLLPMTSTTGQEWFGLTDMERSYVFEGQIMVDMFPDEYSYEEDALENATPEHAIAVCRALARGELCVLLGDHLDRRRREECF